MSGARHSTNPPFEWTEVACNLLRKRWSEGCAASEVARELGGQVTRSAVCGKANRLGLTHTPAEHSRPDKIRRLTPRRERPVKRAAPKGVMVLSPNRGGDVTTAARIENMAAREKPAENVLQMARAFAPLPGHDPVQFGSGGCRWPVGGEGASMVQCGCACEDARPYCTDHCAVAYQPLPKTKRSPAAELARSLRRYA